MGVKGRFGNRSPLPGDIHRRIETLPELLKGKGVILAYLFGSLARGEEGEDVDIALLSDSPAYELRVPIMEHLGTERVDLIDLKTAPLDLKMRIVREGKLIYKRSDEDENRFEMDVIRKYLDFEPIMRRRFELLKRRFGA
ncbi:nucleotidyltransferase [Candidatus Poribacteria bacterium]|nr:MAG: nucleotidyltransferase [Candidatus Poribacteria bacterium]